MKIRILVMNGQRLVQIDQGEEWTTEKVEKAGAVKPGVYNVYLAVTADKTKSHVGPVLYADKESVYQQIGRNYVKHPAAHFDDVPEIGENSTIKYDGDKAVVSKSSIKHGRRMS